jgi:hypothetical protein
MRPLGASVYFSSFYRKFFTIRCRFTEILIVSFQKIFRLVSSRATARDRRKFDMKQKRSHISYGESGNKQNCGKIICIACREVRFKSLWTAGVRLVRSLIIHACKLHRI